MSFTIAVSGKGGTGKTTVSALIIRHLLKTGRGPVLAIDADANANLADALGVEVDQTVGSTIAEFFDNRMNLPAGMTKESYLELKLNQILVETEDLDMLVMGRGEGPGCYCFPNLMIRKFQDELKDNYPYIVIDNEAGMEHLSRRTASRIDCLLLVADTSPKGIRTAARIKDLVASLDLNVRAQHLVVNRLFGSRDTDEEIIARAQKAALDVFAIIPNDQNVYEYDAAERPVRELPDDSPVVKSIGDLVSRITDSVST